MTAVALALVVLGGDFFPGGRERLSGITPRYALGLAIYPVPGYLLIGCLCRSGATKRSRARDSIGIPALPV